MEARTHKRNDWRKTVTLPKNLQEKRDELALGCAENFWGERDSLEQEEQNSFDDIVKDYKSGWNACANLLLPEIKKLEEALPNIPDDCGEHTHLGTYLDHKDCDFIRETLQSLRDFLGSEE